MKQQLSKIIILIVCTSFLVSCNLVKRVPKDKHLLSKNSVYVNNTKNKTEVINNLIYQKPNREVAGFPLRLHIYNTARPNIDSIVHEKINRNPKRKARLERFLSKKQLNSHLESKINFNKWIKKTGEAPVIVDSIKTIKSADRLKAYYFNNGWFNATTSTKKTNLEGQKASVEYFVNTGTPYIIDSLTTRIDSPIIDSLYKVTQHKSFLKKEQYKTESFQLEKDRITTNLRNSGVFHFSEDYVFFDLDSTNTKHKVFVDLHISNKLVRKQDSGYRVPFKIFKIRDVNIFTNDSYKNKEKAVSDTTSHNNFNLYSIGKMRFKPKALTDAVFITPGNVFRDIDRARSYRQLSNLNTFKYPNIEYIENKDSTLTTNIYLTPLEKFKMKLSAEVSQSNIQTIGLALSPSLVMRNIFRGAETLELSAVGSVGASKDAAVDNDQFFDIKEIGVDLKLTFPRLFTPFNTEKIIPKYMFPSTQMSLALTSQTNVGLDKQTFTGAFNFKWFPKNTITNRLDLFNVQYVRNLNPNNYFGVYQNSYNTLNDISGSINYNNGEDLTYPEQTDTFIDDVTNGNTSLTPEDDDYKTVNAIGERKTRLTENNLIFATNFNYVKDNRENLFDENFSIFRLKLELAGNLFSSFSQLLNLEKNSNNQYELFNVAYSQYVKIELDHIKHWDLGKKNVFAMRTFFGIAIPYGNSTNIPFSKSFFAGGTNDNRAWTAYSLGPGSSQSNDEFNEANLKLALSVENRFNLFGDLYGALFIDVGNIWNVLDDVENEQATFSNFSSLKDIAIGSGFGLRYDFGFAVLRGDIGFKTYDPSYDTQNRWFNDYNFGHAVYNIGINYPF